MAVLNPYLHRRLRRLFGSVKVAGEGEAMVARAVIGPDDKPMLLFQHRGEQYRVCCPYCNDTRHRLYVSHMFGQHDAHGRTMNFLAICFNEGCFARDENREDFVETLGEADLENAFVKKGVVVTEAEEVELPGPCKPVSDLKPVHKAHAYLTSRDFDPDYLAERYRVSYCVDSYYFLARERIIIPVYEFGKLKGWQARYPGELPWKDPGKKKGLPPKYFSCPNSHFRSRCIYNFDSMKKWEVGVVVEGPTDVWRFGAMSGCIFGNTVTTAQRRRLLSVFRKRKLVLLLDPEEYDSRSTTMLRRWFEKRMDRGSFAAVKLPEDTDPGSLGRDFLRGFVKDEAASQGVKIRYKRVT
jgi:hypothetical protein